jgi:hypothetical protein
MYVFSLSASAAWSDIRERLQSLRRKDRHITLIEGLLVCAAALCLLLLVMGGLEALLRFKPAGRTMLVAAGALGLGGLLVGRCLLPLLRPLSDDVLARRVDRRFPELHDRVIMTLQLWRQRERGTTPYSPALTDAAIVEGFEATRGVDFITAANARPRIRQATGALGGTLAAFVLILALFFSPLSAAFHRLAHPATDFPVPQKTWLTVSPGDIEAAAGSQTTITADVSGEVPDRAVLRLFTGDALWKSVDLSPIAPATFSHTIHDLKASLTYEVEAGDAVSPRYRISVIDHPTIAAIHLTYQYPAYTQLAPRTTADATGDIAAIKGTRVLVEVTSSQPLGFAQIALENENDPVPMVTSGLKAQANLQVRRDQRYRIFLQNLEGRASVDPPVYQITALPDRMPEVMIVSPGMDTNLTENMMVSLMIAGADDFGFSGMNLVYQKGAEGQIARKPLPVDRQATSMSVPYIWDLSGAGLFPEDVVTYYVELFDNDTVSGPKRAVSQTYTVRFPSIAEIYDRVESDQSQQVADLEEMLKAQEEAREKLKDINRTLEQQDPENGEGGRQELSWEQKKAIEALVSQQEQMAEDVLKAAEEMEQAMDQLGEQDLQSLELIEKMNQLRQLFKEIATPELLKALQQVREAMKALDAQQLKESMKDFELAQEEFMKRLERSLSILKRMRTEQQMMAAVRKTEELLKRQEELQYATQDAAKKPTEQSRQDLAEKQSGLKQDTEALQKDLEELARNMEEIENAPSEGVQEAARTMERQGLAPKMGRISQQLAAGQMSAAAQGQQQVAQDLSQIARQLQALQEQMESGQKQEIAAEMRQAMHNLVELSQDQEALRERTAQPAGRHSRMQDLAEDQQGLLKGASQVADQLVNTSQKSFFISPEIGQALGETLNRMQSASNDLVQRSRGTAAQQQREAMQALNQTVLALQQAMNNMNASGSSSGMMEMLQQLQSMAQQQSGINDQLNQMMEGQNRGKSGRQMSMEERAQMARLAAEQEGLRKSLEQLQREHQQESQLLRRLNEVQREMQETVQQLQQQRVDTELIERQQRILSRLLDASRSMRERDFDEKRMAAPGDETIRRVSPAALPASLLDFSQTLRDDLLRSVRDGTYPQEYEELIRAYFRALSDAPREK